MSSNLCVFTTVESESSVTLLRRSCQRVGIDLHLYETGNWKGYADGKIRGALDFLRTRTEEVCMFVDGHDSFVLAGADRILDVYAEHGKPIISCEKTCWPDAKLASRYEPCDSPFAYPNAGGWIGGREKLVEALSMMVNLEYTVEWPNDDQRCWHEYMTVTYEGKYTLLRDLQCKMFQCMGGTGELDETGRNTITGNWPSVWHFNGRTPGREEWYTKLTGDKV